MVNGWPIDSPYLPVDPAKQRPEGTVQQTVCIVDLATTTSRCFPDLGTVDGFAWSPDGSRIGVDGVGATLPIRLLDVETGPLSTLPPRSIPTSLPRSGESRRHLSWTSIGGTVALVAKPRHRADSRS